MSNFKIPKLQPTTPGKPYRETLVDTDVTGPGAPGNVPVLNADGLIDASLLPPMSVSNLSGTFNIDDGTILIPSSEFDLDDGAL